jgi:hypothetical protein
MERLNIFIKHSRPGTLGASITPTAVPVTSKKQTARALVKFWFCSRDHGDVQAGTTDAWAEIAWGGTFGNRL